MIGHCEAKSEDSKLKFFTNVVEAKDLIEHNYKMMQLYSPQMSVQAKIHVKESVENFECDFNKTEIIELDARRWIW